MKSSNDKSTKNNIVTLRRIIPAFLPIVLATILLVGTFTFALHEDRLDEAQAAIEKTIGKSAKLNIKALNL